MTTLPFEIAHYENGKLVSRVKVENPYIKSTFIKWYPGANTGRLPHLSRGAGLQDYIREYMAQQIKEHAEELKLRADEFTIQSKESKSVGKGGRAKSRSWYKRKS